MLGFTRTARTSDATVASAPSPVQTVFDDWDRAVTEVAAERARHAVPVVDESWAPEPVSAVDKSFYAQSVGINAVGRYPAGQLLSLGY